MTVKYVPLLGFEDDYEIMNEYPFTIRRKSDKYELTEGDNGHGYIRVSLNGKSFIKHVLIAKQFIHNDDPEHKTQVDHINHDRSDNHLDNLRWVSISMNNSNKSSYNGKNCRFVDDIPDESILVDFYDTRTEHHEFDGRYYYHDGSFYYDNDGNYRVLNINVNKTGCRSVRMKDKNKKDVSVVIRKFMEQHDLL